jgi:hypothetical protein
MSPYTSEPVSIGTSPCGTPLAQSLDKFLLAGTFDIDDQPLATAESAASNEEYPRGCLYDYYLYHNKFVDLVGEIDPGYEWVEEQSQNEKRAQWPPTVAIQGDDDDDVSPDVTKYMETSLGNDKVTVCWAKGQGHLFESAKLLDDPTESMNSVRGAVEQLDKIVEAAQ